MIPRLKRSIRVTLSLWYIGILATTLCAFSIVLYTRVTHSLSNYVNGVLASRTDGVAHALFAFWKAEGAPPGNWVVAPSGTLWGEVSLGRFSDLVDRWVRKTHHLDTVGLVRLVDRYGNVLAASGDLTPAALPITRTALASVEQPHAVYETFTVSAGRFRMVTHPVLEGKQLLYLVQAATSLHQTDASLERLRLSLLLLAPLTLLVAGSVGWILSTNALRPLEVIMAQAQRIGPAELNKRLEVPNTDDELERLALTFNTMLDRLERAFQRLRQFSAAASHELRTPLTVMRGELEVALRKPREPGEYQQALRTHLRTVMEMSAIVEELLTLARSDTVEGAIEWRALTLNTVARKVGEQLRPLAEAKQVALDLRTAESVWVRGDARLLERLVTNLLDNAIRYTPAEGRIILRSERRNGDACLIVQDTGSGIRPDELPRIFDWFFSRRSKDPHVPTVSAGVGLSLCRWITEVHQGRIEAVSPPGEGATFTVRLPLSTPAS
ncbi:MAG: HAMP domain-containing protein [Candidatus Omnitrophica bacterium]|nr:HAMP domain-containing protein [Candidatus Omnitrophota bacterium]